MIERSSSSGRRPWSVASPASEHAGCGRRTGAVDSRVRSLASRRAYRVALWDVDPQDWRRPGVSSIVADVLANAGPGDVVLLHDGDGDRSQTVSASSGC